MNLVQSSQILSISLFLKEFFHRHLNKLLSSLFSKNHLYPLMISTTFVQSLTSTSFPKFSKKLLPPAFNLTCLLTLCLLLFNLLTGSSIQLKLLFSKFTMTSSLRWIVVRSLHSFFLTYLLLSTLSIIPSFSLVFKIGLVLMVFLLLGSHPISHLALRQSQSMIPSLHSLLFPVVYPKVPYLAHYFLLSILLLFARWSQKIPSNIICMLMTPSCTSLSLLQILLYLLTHLPPLSMTFSPGWIWTNYSLIHQKLNFFSLAQNNNVSNFLILLTYLSAMISSQSVPLLAILASSLTLTCLSLIKSNLYPNLVIFISETSVEFVIFFLFLQLQLLQIHLSPANLTTVIHYTLASHKSISTNFNAFKTHWHASSQTPQNTNTSHQYSKNYTGFQSNKELITNSVFSHTKHLQINNQHIFTIVFHFLHILFLQDLLIHSFFPFHMFDHHLAKGLSLLSVHVFGIHSLLIPETRLLYQYSVPGSKHTSSKLLSLPRLFPISLDCLPGFWFLLFSFYALSNDT